MQACTYAQSEHIYLQPRIEDIMGISLFSHVHMHTILTQAYYPLGL